jgi:hypothetical protein
MEVQHWTDWNIKHLKDVYLRPYHFEDAPEGYEFWDKVLALEITEI